VLRLWEWKESSVSRPIGAERRKGGAEGFPPNQTRMLEEIGRTPLRRDNDLQNIQPGDVAAAINHLVKRLKEHDRHLAAVLSIHIEKNDNDEILFDIDVTWGSIVTQNAQQLQPACIRALEAYKVGDAPKT
jgi:hypothetical protein